MQKRYKNNKALFLEFERDKSIPEKSDKTKIYDQIKNFG